MGGEEHKGGGEAIPYSVWLRSLMERRQWWSDGGGRGSDTMRRVIGSWPMGHPLPLHVPIISPALLLGLCPPPLLPLSLPLPPSPSPPPPPPLCLSRPVQSVESFQEVLQLHFLVESNDAHIDGSDDVGTDLILPNDEAAAAHHIHTDTATATHTTPHPSHCS